MWVGLVACVGARINVGVWMDVSVCVCVCVCVCEGRRVGGIVCCT